MSSSPSLVRRYSTSDRQIMEWSSPISVPAAKSYRFSSCKTNWRLHLNDVFDPEPKLGLISGAEKAEISYDLRIWFEHELVDLNGAATKTNVLETDSIVFHGSAIFVRNKYILLKGLSHDISTPSNASSVTLKLLLDITTINVETVVNILQSTFSSDIESAIKNNEEFQDTTLIVGQKDSKEEIKANKFMLMARSPVFARMFQIDMKEKVQIL